jgi:hypothetical protein
VDEDDRRQPGHIGPVDLFDVDARDGSCVLVGCSRGGHESPFGSRSAVRSVALSIAPGRVNSNGGEASRTTSRSANLHRRLWRDSVSYVRSIVAVPESPPLGDSWEALLVALRRESAITVERTVDHIRTVPSYAELDIDALRVFVRRSHDVVLDGVEQRRKPVAPHDSAVFDEHGEVRARQGIPVADLLAVWRVGLDSLHKLAREVAPPSPDRDALLLEFLERAMVWVDFAMLASAEGHRRTELTLAREQHHAQANLLRRIMAGTVAPAEIRTALAPLGVDPDAPYYAIYARPDTSADVGAIERYLGVGLVTRGKGIVALIDGHVCGFIASLPKAPAPTAIGFSEPAALPDLKSAFTRARRSLETALAIGAKGTFDLATLGLEAAVVSDTDIGNVMVDRYIDALQGLTGGDAMLETVERYLANDLSVDPTARDLGVHVNTVRQRLGRLRASPVGRCVRPRPSSRFGGRSSVSGSVDPHARSRSMATRISPALSRCALPVHR